MTNYPYYCFKEWSSRRFYTGRYWNTTGKGIAIVAVVTGNVDWAAYIGADDGQSEAACCLWTAGKGAKLREEEARYFFPEIELPYRQ